MKISPVVETETHDTGNILRDALDLERAALAAYYDLLKIVRGKSVLLEEYAREMIVREEIHQDEIDKMLRRPGEIATFQH